jgi:hypothetical protein
MARKKELTAAELLSLHVLPYCLVEVWPLAFMTYVRDIGVGGTAYLPAVLIAGGFRDGSGAERTYAARVNLTRRGDPYSKATGGSPHRWRVDNVSLTITGRTATGVDTVVAYHVNRPASRGMGFWFGRMDFEFTLFIQAKQ